MSWSDKSVTITGGAALIGSHLAEALIQRGVKPSNLTIADNFSAGKKENIRHLVHRGEQWDRSIKIIAADLRDYEDADWAVGGQDVVFHLACQHGGRGYVDTHASACANNLELDATVFRACANEGVKQVVFASSACVYPLWLQTDPYSEALLSEEMCHWKMKNQADGTYGWAKLMGEMGLETYHNDGKFIGKVCRFFTVYGPRMTESHAIAALIAKAFIKQEPFEIWGDGTQFRNWTYVTDTVEGMILLAEAENPRLFAYNIGLEQRFTVLEAAEAIWRIMGWKPDRIQFKPDAPTGPVNRIADNSAARYDLGWEQKVSFTEGLERTIAWYTSTHNREAVARELHKPLTER